MSQLNKLIASQDAIHDEILDYVEENPIDTLIVTDDVEACLLKIEELRNEYRRMHKDLKQLSTDNYDTIYKDEFDKTMLQVKQYVIMAKGRKTELRIEDHSLKKQQNNQQINATQFLINDVDRLLEELFEDVKAVDHTESDDDIRNKMKTMPSLQKRMENISQKFQKIHEIIPDDYPKKGDILSHLTKHYDALAKRHFQFQKEIGHKTCVRELNKEKAFEASKLNIHLKKFRGYESQLDIYSFQSLFDKVHLKNTPKKLLPDLLKNNYLDGPALITVKRLTDINELWRSLKKSYGDPRMMLMKKLAVIENMAPIWKAKDSEKVKDDLGRIVNVM